MEIKTKFKTIDEYFASLTEIDRQLLTMVRQAVKQAAPNAIEVISYNMPAIKQNGILVYYAAHQNHIGFYPTAKPIEVFKAELSPYKTSKGAIQFPHNQIDLQLITKIVEFRMKEDLAKGKKESKEETPLLPSSVGKVY
jgi:uncharacterized protein YdhG (YjbR/CyaY superfamily)